MNFKKGLAFLLAMALGFSPVMVSAAELEPDEANKDYTLHTISFTKELDKKTEVEKGGKVELSVEVGDKKETKNLPEDSASTYPCEDNQVLTDGTRVGLWYNWHYVNADGTWGPKDMIDGGLYLNKITVSAPDSGERRVAVDLESQYSVCEEHGLPHGECEECEAAGKKFSTIQAGFIDGTVSSSTTIVVKEPVAVESVSVELKSTKLKVGENTIAKATVKPEGAKQDVTWKSSNEKVATVDKDGKVTAVGVGKADITATSVQDTTKSGSATVNVEDDVESVKVEPKTATVAPSKTVQLKATVAPEGASQEVEYKSSDEKIATVDKNGLVTGVAVGTATITVTSTDDSSKSDTAEITVKEDVAPTEVKVTGSDKVLKTGGTKQLKAEVLPAEASQEVNWSSSKKSVATVDENGKVTAKGSGTATITATSAVDEKIKATFKVKVAGMKFDTTDLTMKAGDKKTIKITFTNDSLKSAKVTSDKKKIIDGKVVTGSKKLTIKAKKNKKGTATITVKSNAGLSQKITVNVQKDKVTTKKIKLYNNSGKKKSAISVKKGKKATYTIKATPDKVSTGETVKISKKPNSKYAKATINKDGKLVVTGVKATGNNKVFLKLKAGKKEAKFNIKVTK